ncbi:MAG: alpha/beta hydrolase, partial [Verrucomicrobiota bacterium]
QAVKIKRLMQHWSLNRISLLGMDMGGQPALVFAADFPDLVDSVTVVNSLLYGNLPTSWEIRLLRRFGWNRTILRHLPAIVFARAEATFLTRENKLSPAVRADFWNSFRRPAVRRFIIRLCAGYQGALPGLPELYRTIRCPVRAIWGGEERHFPVNHAAELVAQLPGSGLTVLHDGRHWLPWSHPEELAAIL